MTALDVFQLDVDAFTGMRATSLTGLTQCFWLACVGGDPTQHTASKFHVRKAVERMNGKVGMESEPNQRSRFLVAELGNAD